jgi:uncharacterized protein (DUF433 family)
VTPATSHTESTRGELGQGLYALGDLAAYLAYSGDAHDGEYALEWLTRALNQSGHQSWQPDYSFSDLISLFVVRELVRQGTRPSEIREAEAFLRQHWHTDRPFALERFQTDGVDVFIRGAHAGQLEAANRWGQQTLYQAVQERLVSVGYSEDGAANRWHPTAYVTLTPDVQFGAPRIEGRRLTTADVAALAERMSVEDVSAEYRVPSEAVRAAVKFERHLRALRG